MVFVDLGGLEGHYCSIWLTLEAWRSSWLGFWLVGWRLAGYLLAGWLLAGWTGTPGAEVIRPGEGKNIDPRGQQEASYITLAERYKASRM